MNDKPLHDLLDGALAGEPPIGPVDQNALAAGIRLRRRRRIRAAAATAAAAAVIAVAIPAGLGVLGHLPRPQQPPAAPTLYVANDSPNISSNGGVVVPVNTATNTAGKPIHLAGLLLIAITPDGKSVYAASNSGTILPINTATNAPGKPIHVFSRIYPAIAITP